MYDGATKLVEEKNRSLLLGRILDEIIGTHTQVSSSKGLFAANKQCGWLNFNEMIVFLCLYIPTILKWTFINRSGTHFYV